MSQKKLITVFILLLFLKSICMSVSAKEDSDYLPVSYDSKSTAILEPTPQLNTRQLYEAESTSLKLDQKESLIPPAPYKLLINENVRKDNTQSTFKNAQGKYYHKIQKLSQKSFNYVQQNKLFYSMPCCMNLSSYPPYDTDWQKNQLAVSQGKFSLSRYNITLFSDTSYSVSHYNSLISLYYDKNGRLGFVQYDTQKKRPYYSFKYSYPSGALEKISLRYDPAIDFVFNANKNLEAIWDGTKCYDLNGNEIKTRKTVKISSGKWNKFMSALNKVNKFLGSSY